MIRWIFPILLSNNLWMSSASIAGVTYMDNFDFEERYKDINECNPLYWHPLHLPARCFKIFESAILSRLKSNIPIRLVKDRKEKIIEISSPYAISPSHGSYETYGVEVPEAPIRPEISKYGHPFAKMLKLLNRDVEDHPRAPTVGFLPNVGFVALYQQPISRKSEKIIKKVANAYTPDVLNNDPPYLPPYLDTPWNKKKSSEQYDIRVIKKKLKKGNVVGISERNFFK